MPSECVGGFEAGGIIDKIALMASPSRSAQISGRSAKAVFRQGVAIHSEIALIA
jgi:hypothetical protein